MRKKESTQRAMVVAEARSWLRTPYAHAADIKGVGVDCAMILVRVFHDLKLVPKFDPRPYPPDFYMNQEEQKYLNWVKEYCGEVTEALPGDILTFQFGRCVSHAGICIGWPWMIHAYRPDRHVVLCDLSVDPIMERVRGIYSYWAK